MNVRRSLALVPLLALAVAACGSGGPDLPPAAEFPALGAPAKLRVHAPGANGQVLRFKAKADATTVSRMTMDMSMDISAQGQSMDMTMNMVMGLENKVTAVEPDGAFSMDSTVQDADVKVGGAIAAQVPAGALDDVGAMMKGETFSIKADATGRLRGMESGVKNPLMDQFQAGMDQAIRGGVVALPEEAVGVGAKWDALMSLEMKGALVHLMTSNELVALEGRKATIKMVLNGKASDQRMEVEGGQTADIESLVLEASGTFEIDLDNPTWAKGGLDMTMKMAMKVMGESAKATMKLKMSSAPKA